MNELKKSKDHHRDRVSSSDRDQHNKHRNSRQLQVHDYDSSYTKASSKRDTYSTREPTRDSYQQASKHHAHNYHQTETKSYRESAEISGSSSSRHSSDQKRSSKSGSNSSSNPDNTKHNQEHQDNRKSDKYQRTNKVKIEAEVNEIFSEEEDRSSSESDESGKSSNRRKSEVKKATSQERRASDSEQHKVEINEPIDQESENLRAEIDLRNKLKRKIQAESNIQIEENEENDSGSSKTSKEQIKSSKDTKRDRKEEIESKNRDSRSPASRDSNTSSAEQALSN